jgi:tetratricopeptide (TPR) repeat protein
LGLYNKGLSLEALDRQADAVSAYEKLIDRFGEATVTAPRVVVSWGLSRKVQLLPLLGRASEMPPLLEQLIARGDEQHEPELADTVAWALQLRASQLGDEGRLEEGVALLDELVRRFGETELEAPRRRVATALSSKANALGQLGQRDEQVAVCDELIARFGSATDQELRESVVDAYRSKGVALDELDRLDEALAAYDAGLSLIAGIDLIDKAALPRILINKGVSLEHAKRHEEAVIVFDSAATSFRDLRESGDVPPDLLARAAQAVLYKIGALGALGRIADAGLAVSQLASLLPAGERDGHTRSRGNAGGDSESEADLAELLVQIHSGDSWDLLITGGDDESSRREMRPRP